MASRAGGAVGWCGSPRVTLRVQLIPTSVGTAKLRILVVEDDATVREAMERMFSGFVIKADEVARAVGS